MTGSVITPTGFSVSNWKSFQKNTLQAFCSITLPSGMVVHECSVHRKADAQWVSLPARRYETAGKVAYAPLVEFVSAEAKRRFQDQALAAVDAFLAAGGGR